MARLETGRQTEPPSVGYERCSPVIWPIMLMRVIPVSTVFLICAWSQFCAAGGTNTIAIGGGNESQVGSGFANRFSVPSKDEATAKLKSFRELGRAVTLREFLGGDIEFIRITFYDKPIVERIMESPRLLAEKLQLDIS